MSDRSAWALAEALLSENSAASLQSLFEAAMTDPPLFVWCVCVAGHWLPWESVTEDGISQWLADNLLQVLDWDRQGRGPPLAWEASATERFAEQVAEDLQLAELAALVAARAGSSVAAQARWIALLGRACQWLALLADGRHGDAQRFLEPLKSVDQHPAAIHVVEAVRYLHAREEATAGDLDLDFCRRQAAEGRRRWLEVLPGASGRLAELVRKLRRLDQLETRFQETLEAEKLAAMAEFAAGAGHEINNPLTVIGGRAQLLLKQETDPERRRELALMNAQVKRAYEMIADMRLFARPPRLEPQKFDLAALVDQLVADMVPQASERATSLVRTGQPGALEVEADPVQVNVALRALCTNSLEAIGHDGRVEVELQRIGENAVIRVSDDGPGILPEQRRHLFDPFYSARQAGRGLGLGLSKCWRIVTNHGGHIDVESPTDRGAAFAITLPCRRET